MGWRSAWLLGWAFGACSAAAPLQAPGGRCFVVGDCELGLVCVTQANQTRRCSSDLSGIVSTEEAGAPARRPTGDGGQVIDVGLPAEAAVLYPANDAEGGTGGDDAESDTGRADVESDTGADATDDVAQE